LVQKRNSARESRSADPMTLSKLPAVHLTPDFRLPSGEPVPTDGRAPKGIQTIEFDWDVVRTVSPSPTQPIRVDLCLWVASESGITKLKSCAQNSLFAQGL
jgi:hypothetical protein